MDHLEAAALLAGASRAENKTVSQPTNVHLVTMEAVAASEDGTVLVDPGGDVFTPDDSQYVEIETVGSISEGDDVTVLLTGEPGGPMDVLSLGPIGEGDRQNAAIADAAQAAQTAWEYAESAHDAADAAQQSADDAAAAASSAQGSATRANTAANDALAQLGTVQDVLGVVEWVTEHGTWSLTTDTAVDESKVYYTRTGSGTTADPYVYSPVAEPTAEGLPGYYELSIDAALSQYVASHLSLTDAGLYVIRDASGYKLLVSSDGMSVIDPQGHVVTKQGENITFDSSRPQYIGGEQAYIVYYDSDEDGSPDTIRIGGHVLMGGDKTLSEVLTELEQSSTVGNPNLIPAPDYFSNVTDVGDGWLHVEYANTSSSAASHYWNIKHCDAVEPGKTYTIMLEFRNWVCSTAPTGNYMYLQQIAGYQFWGGNGVRCDGKEEKRQGYATYIHYEDVADGSMCAHIVKVADTEHNPTDAGMLFRYRMYTPPNSTNSFDIRWSLYEGDYSGPYKPYVDLALSERIDDAIATAAADATSKASAAQSNAISAAAADATAKANDAARTATSYLTDTGPNGFWVTPEGAGPVNGSAAATTSGWNIGDVMELWRSGVSMFKAWVEGAATKVRIGATELGGSAMMNLLLSGGKIGFMKGTDELSSIEATDSAGQRDTYLHFGNNSHVRAAQSTASAEYPRNYVQLYAGHGLDSDTSAYGYDAHVSVISQYSVSEGFKSEVSAHGESLLLSTPDKSELTIPMRRAIDHLSGGDVLGEWSYSASVNSMLGMMPGPDSYTQLLVIFEDSTGRRGSVWVDAIYSGSLVGQTFGCTTTGANSASGMVVRSKSYLITSSGIEVAADSYGRETYGKVTVSPTGGVTFANANEIAIVRLIGFR